MAALLQSGEADRHKIRKIRNSLKDHHTGQVRRDRNILLRRPYLPKPSEKDQIPLYRDRLSPQNKKLRKPTFTSSQKTKHSM